MTMMNNIATFADGKNLCLFFEEGDTAIYYNFENINISEILSKKEFVFTNLSIAKLKILLEKKDEIN